MEGDENRYKPVEELTGKFEWNDESGPSGKWPEEGYLPYLVTYMYLTQTSSRTV